jgi:glucose/arabinose dehydrogenase
MRRTPLSLVLSAVVVAAAAVGVSLVVPSASAAVGDFNFSQPQVAASGLAVPWGMAFLPDGSALVSERDSARLLQIRPGSAPTVVATVGGVVPGGEGGLLGIAVSPTFATDNLVYAYYTAASENRIVRFRLDNPANQQAVLTGLAKANFHNGGRIAFGPDGMLYAGVGDATNTANAQNQQSLNGKILRMRPDGSVPPDNPIAGSRIYSLGHRNVQGLAWDSQGRLFATEFGQDTWDEVNYIVPGGNYGWPVVEGQSTNPSYRSPIVTWRTADASPSGAALVGGNLFVAALRGTKLWQVPLNGTTAGTPVPQLNGTYGRLRTVMLGPDGYLWVATSNRDGRGTPASTDDRILRFPPTGTPTSAAPTSTRPPTSAAPTSTRPPTSAVPTSTVPGPPSAPVLSYTLNGNTLTLSWTASTSSVGISAYLIDEETSDTVYRRTVPGTTTSLTLTIAYPNELHRYWMYARDAAGNVSAQSNTVSFGTPPTCPPPGACMTSPPPTTRTPTSAPPTSAAPGCAVTWEVNQWSNGFVVNVTLTNRGTTALNGWTLTWTFGGNQQITGSWSSVITQSGASVTARNATWNGSVPAGGSTTFGFQGTYTGTNARPTAISLGGTPCSVS